MTINNFKQISALLDISDPDTFYIAHVLQRKTENPLVTYRGKRLKTIYVSHDKPLDEEKVVSLCIELNARAYINVNPVSYSAAALGMVKKVLIASFPLNTLMMGVTNSLRKPGIFISDGQNL